MYCTYLVPYEVHVYRQCLLPNPIKFIGIICMFELKSILLSFFSDHFFSNFNSCLPLLNTSLFFVLTWNTYNIPPSINNYITKYLVKFSD